MNTTQHRRQAKQKLDELRRVREALEPDRHNITVALEIADINREISEHEQALASAA